MAIKIAARTEDDNDVGKRGIGQLVVKLLKVVLKVIDKGLERVRPVLRFADGMNNHTAVGRGDFVAAAEFFL